MSNSMPCYLYELCLCRIHTTTVYQNDQISLILAHWDLKVPDLSHLVPIWPFWVQIMTSMAYSIFSLLSSLDDSLPWTPACFITTIVTSRHIVQLHLFKLVPGRWSYESSTVFFLMQKVMYYGPPKTIMIVLLFFPSFSNLIPKVYSLFEWCW